MKIFVGFVQKSIVVKRSGEWRLPDELLMKEFSLMSVYDPRNGIILCKNCYVMITSFLTLIHRAIFTREIMIKPKFQQNYLF